METIKQHYAASVMSYITLSLTSIIGIGLVTIFISFWVTELADKDAQAINLSGSMRMQTYHIGLVLQQGDTERTLASIEKLNRTWQHTLFSQQRKNDTPATLNTYFDRAYRHWSQTLQPVLLQLAQDPGAVAFPMGLLEHQVDLTDQLVNKFQQSAESKIRNLRAFQLFALFITIGVGSLIFYLIKHRIEKPLLKLTQASHKIGKGDFGYKVDVEGKDELALLAAVINQMSASINDMYQKMDERIKQRTQELSHNNTTLEFLFNTARRILDSHNKPLDCQKLLNELANALKGSMSLELCLFTAQGKRPYLRLAPQNCSANNASGHDCSGHSCADCQGKLPNHLHQEQPLLFGKRYNEKYPIVRHNNHYGVINVRTSNTTPLDPWQEKLLSSAADQFALALSLSVQKDQEHRLAMLNERTVIARELHDSLAQALSYLKIQVTRLQKSQDKETYQQQQPIIDELREGLSSAYRQLRELLTTFRLKMDTGLQTALESTVTQLRERSHIDIQLHYQLANLPLSPAEEIHLLQIVREASQNAVNHSQGKQVDIVLQQRQDSSIELIVTDDGIGMPDTPEKLNHYGLAIINERGRQLGGKISIQSPATGGTQVAFHFKPAFLQQSA